MPEIATSKITAARIRFLFDYDPDSGEFIRREYSKGYVDNVITSHDLEIDGEKHSTSRYVWLHYYGEWPPLDKFIDHINRDRKDNRLVNLRLATSSQNNMNKATSNQHRYKGIEFRSKKRPWAVRIWHEGKRIYIGSYLTIEEAAEASKEACLKYHGEFACVD